VLTVGKIAALAGVRADTLRYYERERLLAPASKSSSGYRLYDSDALRRIRFIKHAQSCRRWTMPSACADACFIKG
jgi:MerR family Zn(II)-responsive transcriptional regulator of zntA